MAVICDARKTIGHRGNVSILWIDRRLREQTRVWCYWITSALSPQRTAVRPEGDARCAPNMKIIFPFGLAMIDIYSSDRRASARHCVSSRIVSEKLRCTERCSPLSLSRFSRSHNARTTKIARHRGFLFVFLNATSHRDFRFFFEQRVTLRRGYLVKVRFLRELACLSFDADLSFKRIRLWLAFFHRVSVCSRRKEGRKLFNPTELDSRCG